MLSVLSPSQQSMEQLVLVLTDEVSCFPMYFHTGDFHCPVYMKNIPEAALVEQAQPLVIHLKMNVGRTKVLR